MKIELSKPFVVVPWDFSDLSLAALKHTVEMIGDAKAVRVVHVAYIPSPYEYGIAWEMASEETMGGSWRNRFASSSKAMKNLRTWNSQF